MIALAFLLLAAMSAHPQRDRADASFSTIPLGTMRSPAAPGLARIDAPGCAEAGECEWADANGVRHYFWEQDELVVKRVLASDAGGQAIAAVGIGRARAQAEVIANVRAFLGDVALGCAEEEEEEDAAPASTRCDASLDEGWLRIWFDAAGTLREVRIDARHFT